MVISRVIIRVTPFRALITLLITYLLSPLPLQVTNCRGGAHRRGHGDRPSPGRRVLVDEVPVGVVFLSFKEGFQGFPSGLGFGYIGVAIKRVIL